MGSNMEYIRMTELFVMTYTNNTVNTKNTTNMENANV